MAGRYEMDIDPVKYGAMYQKVRDLDEKVDKIETQVEALLSFANKAKGMVAIGVFLVPIVTAVVTLIVNKMWG